MKIRNLADIRIDGGTQSREAINQAAVAEYAFALEQSAVLPPVIVFFDGVNTWLADGFHRYFAHAKVGATCIDCDERTGTQDDAVLYSTGANQAHGLQRTSEDKRRAVRITLALRSDWTNAAIARHCGVSDKTVAAHRDPHIGNSDVSPTLRTYTTKHGTQATMNVSGQQQATKQRTKAPDTDELTVATPPENTVGLIAPDAPETAPVSQAEDGAGQIGELRDQLAELAQNLEEVVADNASMSKVFDADDKLMAALAENKRLRAEVSSLRERVNGLLGEKNEAVRLMKSWRRKFEKAGVAA